MGRSRNVIRFYLGVLWSPFTSYPFAFLLTLAWDRGNSCEDQIASQDPDKGRKRSLITWNLIWHSSWSSLPHCGAPCPFAGCFRCLGSTERSLMLVQGWQWVSGIDYRLSVITTLGQFQLQEPAEVVLIIQKRTRFEPQPCPCVSVC